MLRHELVYEGSKVWTRAENDRWRRTVTEMVSDVAPDENALEFLSYMPTLPPERVVGSREDFRAYCYSPEFFGLPDVGGASVLSRVELVGEETVNGVRALHYRGGVNGGIRNRSFGADLWIAADHFYLVRFRASYSGPPDAVVVANETARVDVYEANKPFTVNAPAR